MRDSVAPLSCTENGIPGLNDADWTIVFDDTCPVVKKLGWVLQHWDREGIFNYVGRGTTDSASAELIDMLEETPWSLMLIGKHGESWHGPEAIPFILKNLPSGKIAAVTYTIPGTMWLTRQLYYMVSRNRHMLQDHRMHNRTA
jgi:predicted DCC family thiol-disulfide oxidoreductase YuxK